MELFKLCELVLLKLGVVNRLLTKLHRESRPMHIHVKKGLVHKVCLLSMVSFF